MRPVPSPVCSLFTLCDGDFGSEYKKKKKKKKDRETRLKKKIQNLEDTVSRLSEVQEKTLRESNEGREKIARQLSNLKSNSTLQAKKLEKRHQPRHEEKKEPEFGSTSESPSCSSSSNPGHVETRPNSRDHSKGRPQGNTHGKEKASSEPKVNMPSSEQTVTNDDSDTNSDSVETWTSVLKKATKTCCGKHAGNEETSWKTRWCPSNEKVCFLRWRHKPHLHLTGHRRLLKRPMSGPPMPHDPITTTWNTSSVCGHSRKPC